VSPGRESISPDSLRARNMKVWIGTSGYSYSDWAGTFYPPGTRPNRMLRYYSGRFPAVELNFTFYRLPTPAMLARLAEQTPADFRFVVKLPRTLSHAEDPGDLAPFREAAAELHDRGKLLGLLCQLPQSTHHGRQHLAWLDRLGRELTGFRLAVEFRHRSWARPDVPPWLHERGLDLVSVDVPDLPALYPRGLVRSGSRLYVRFHSRNAGNWYRSDRDRYDYAYSDEELQEWADALAATPPEALEAFLFFNNCHAAQSATAAWRIRELLEGRRPGVEVVGPPGLPDEPRQRTLFD
jgi:uncharacterized protein YecE (DUF72 family)